MNIDKRLLNLISLSMLVVLVAIFITAGGNSELITAIFLLPLSAITYFLVKKRSILSINRSQVLMLMSVIGLLYLMVYYLSGLYFRFYRTGYRIDLNTVLKYILPVIVIILATELIRGVIRAQNSRLADVISYFSCVFAEVIITANIGTVFNFNRFMDIVGLALFPAVTSNLLYHYIAKRYGILPNVIYRLLTTLYIYVIPFRPAVPDSLFSFVNLFIPLIIYIFIDALYERKMRYALGKKNRFSNIASIVAVVLMSLVIMLISNQFRFGALVIATDSMTGELNRGDAAIYERYDGEIINVGQIIVFEKDSSVIVHRVVDIKNIDGVTQYYTKGDINESNDSGFITKGNIVGTVRLKMPYVGYPTVWLRNLFNR